MRASGITCFKNHLVHDARIFTPLYYGGGHIADPHRRASARTLVATRVLEMCEGRRLCARDGCVWVGKDPGGLERASYRHTVCLPVSHFLIKPIQPGSPGCSVSVSVSDVLSNISLDRQRILSANRVSRCLHRAASMRMSDGACSRRLESEMGKTKVIDLIFEIEFFFRPFLLNSSLVLF